MKHTTNVMGTPDASHTRPISPNGFARPQDTTGVNSTSLCAMDVMNIPNASQKNMSISPNESTRAQDSDTAAGPPLAPMPNIRHLKIEHGNFNQIGRDFNLYKQPSATHSGFEGAVNELAKDLMLEWVKLTPDFKALIQWTKLPRGFCIEFSEPVVVGHCGSPVLDATAGTISSDTQPHKVPLSLPEKNEKSFRDLASDILIKDTVELTLHGNFSLADNHCKLNAKMTLDGLDSLQGAIDLEDVKILKGFQDGVHASVKTTIRNRTRIVIEHITLKSADILYNSTTIGYLKNQTFKLSPGSNGNQEFFWIFTPPLAHDRDEDFRGFISRFLTTDQVINITLDLKKIEIKAGDRLVEIDGIEVKTSITGIKKPIISHVDVYLGLGALRQEVSFRFRLKNPIDAPIKVIDSEVHSTFEGHLISHFVHCFKHLSVSEPLGERDSEVVTAKLKNSLLKTIWLVRGCTKFPLEVNIRKCKISIDGREIQNLEFKLHGVTTEIHFGKPAGPKPVNTETASEIGSMIRPQIPITYDPPS